MGRKIVRISRRLGASLLVSLFLLAVGIHLDQYLLRRRAEHLQSDIRSLELRKSTYSEARVVIDCWWNDVHQNGPCRTDWCDVEITLNRDVMDQMIFLWKHSVLITTYRWLGGRPAMITGSVRVLNNIVIAKGIDEYVAGKCSSGNDGQVFCTAMMGHARTGPRRFIDIRHPEYTFYRPSGCEICVDAEVTFSPYANPADVQRLTDVNFDCITRWTPCETEKDILPTAWAQVQSEGPLSAAIGGTCTETLRALSRELGCVPLATVTDVTDIGEGPQLAVRWENQCGLTQSSARQNTFPQTNRDALIRDGDRLMIFEDEIYHFSNPCAVSSATQENLRAAQQGASEGLSEHFDLTGLPVGNIRPPNVKVE